MAQKSLDTLPTHIEYLSTDPYDTYTMYNPADIRWDVLNDIMSSYYLCYYQIFGLNGLNKMGVTCTSSTSSVDPISILFDLHTHWQGSPLLSTWTQTSECACTQKMFTSSKFSMWLMDHSVLVHSVDVGAWQQVGFITGILQVQFSHTIPVPTKTVPMVGTDTYWPIIFMVCHKTRGILFTCSYLQSKYFIFLFKYVHLNIYIWNWATRPWFHVVKCKK